MLPEILHITAKYAQKCSCAKILTYIIILIGPIVINRRYIFEKIGRNNSCEWDFPKNGKNQNQTQEGERKASQPRSLKKLERESENPQTGGSDDAGDGREEDSIGETFSVVERDESLSIERSVFWSLFQRKWALLKSLELEWESFKKELGKWSGERWLSLRSTDSSGLE